MGFLMALRVNTFPSCQSVAKILQTGQQAENASTANFWRGLFLFDLFCFAFFSPPIFGLGGRPAQRFTPCPHLLVHLRNLCHGRNLDCGWLLSLRTEALQLLQGRGVPLWRVRDAYRERNRLRGASRLMPNRGWSNQEDTCHSDNIQ